MNPDQINVADAPSVPGLSFRRFRGESDYPGMVAVLSAAASADRIESAPTVKDMARSYAHLVNCDPYRDMILAEVAGEIVGYTRVWWHDEPQTGRIYESAGFLVPAWRRKGIGRAMLEWAEGRQRVIAASHPAGEPRWFQASASQSQEGAAILLERAGYRPARYFYQMLRASLDDIPDAPLPAGLEVRPVLPEHYRAIWASVDETSRDEWGYKPLTDEDYQAWLSDETRFQPHLWQIAWDVATGQVAGHVLTFIDYGENERFSRRRGYTEGIGVGRAWRRRGLARALIARSLQAQKAAGMTESALTPDSENLGAIGLYESCGFRVVRRDTVYRKPLDYGRPAPMPASQPARAP